MMKWPLNNGHGIRGWDTYLPEGELFFHMISCYSEYDSDLPQVSHQTVPDVSRSHFHLLFTYTSIIMPKTLLEI